MCRVLLVDDEKNVLMTLAIGLQRSDFSVDKAQNGPQALEMLKKGTYDFVVSDIRMLPMDGYTLASKIHKQYPDVGIILMSAYGFDTKRHKKGFAQLTKPFEMSELVQLLHEEDKREKRHIYEKRRQHLGKQVAVEDGKRIFQMLSRGDIESCFSFIISSRSSSISVSCKTSSFASPSSSPLFSSFISTLPIVWHRYSVDRPEVIESPTRTQSGRTYVPGTDRFFKSRFCSYRI